MNKYPKYKNSGVAWLGEIPEEWEEVGLGSLFNQRKEKVSDTDYPPLSVTKNGVLPQLANAAKSNDGDNRKLVLKGDFAINSRSDRKGSSGVSIYDGSVSLIYIILKPVSIEPRYSEYLLKSYYFKEEYYRYGRGIVEDLWTTKYSEMKNMIIPSAPKPEQTAIANFLDYKLEKIDRFISKKRQLIKLLNEQKAAIINQTVTKGLNPNAKMEPSGIEWLGDIPESWEVKPLKYIANVVLGKMLCNEDKGNYFKKPYLKSKNIQWLNADVTDVEEMWFSEKEMEIYRLKAGDLVLSEGGEVGKTCFWENQIEECYIQNSAHKVTINNDGISKYFLYLFFIYGHKGGFESIVNRVSIAHLTKDKLINLKCLSPTLGEQKQIALHIETETTKISKTITTIAKEITLVEEYKTALIAEAVTGKIDVRDFEIPQTQTPLAMVAEATVSYNNEN
ncbi:MAG: restriction endonuclease subunit S [Methylococcales symbiont of Hymedesmia sp. n. MRB-2018]|nr:MAG: restriction endonuclease subunit S [Methylococcales symbiont of Hymedesmia sp. n. MRB-2018]